MRYKLIFIGFLGLLFISCKKKKVPEPEVPQTLQHGMLVLNEGLFQQNNSTLGWLNFSDNSYTSNFFEQKTDRSLGDTGNDLDVYGGKIYIIVNVSSTIEILDRYTGNSIHQISMIANGTPKQPRSIVFSGSKAYITCYDGFVDVLDTTSLSITARIPVGANPEGLAVSNGKLFVANSGGLNFPNVDSTLSVIDLGSNQEITRITVGKNPGSVQKDANGEIYVISRGDYAGIPSRMHRVNPNTNTLVQSFNFDAGGIYPFNNQFLISYHDFASGENEIALFDPNSESLINPQYISTAGIQTLYGIHYSSITHKIYCMDAKNYTVTGQIHVYSSSGIFETTYNVGLNPSKILIYD
ncbi:YncE family protein [Fluviicola taffensis]|uniref:40-residue YVTN family beta-propeller repeat protein n=1 Tax=Fluviicola taffensis (strain DSM 16823 / NCIMB 13979 / RW262) TaxID=755732 RepID=F2IA93_FLUTR|nr:YncE family protein [Fluviicola taffensis]AEA42028.1 40-residue YVTN family beta-propeller repeat protein [Fluviicola taffensis DSM 16823]